MKRHDTASRQRRANGFTLVELLLVLMILGVLAAIVVPKFAGRSEQARLTAAKTQIAGFETALDAYEVDMGRFPSSLSELMENKDDSPNWQGPYLGKDVPVDPWGNPYLYETPAKNSQKGYDIMSNGPDGRKGGGDDITNW
jgi:general secretion pathway protein G